jgi:phospholipase C
VKRGPAERSGCDDATNQLFIATVRKRFGIGQALTARDAAAPDLDSVLALPQPTNRGPARLKALPYAPSPKAAAVAQTQPLNSMQRALVGLAARI